MEVYFDNSATTRCYDSVKDIVVKTMTEDFGNPSAMHLKGVDAEKYERLIPIEGTPVDMLNPPEGCPFAPRCEHAKKICLQKMPPYVQMGEEHRAACWLRVQDCLNEAKKDHAWINDENNEKTEVDSHE